MSTQDLAKAAALLRQGGVVAFPTETVYGLGANALDPNAVARIYDLKRRPRSSPLIVHVATIAMAQELILGWTPLAQTLAEHFWPGPLTLVLPKQSCVPDLVTAGLSTVGVRMPAHPLALELLRRAGIPLAAPSANRFTHISPTTARHVREGIPDVDMVLDGGPCQVGIESTVVSLAGSQPLILRLGMVSEADLEKATGVRWHTFEETVAGPAPSPGLHPRHYSPRTPFFVLAADVALPPGRGIVLSLPGEAAAYARALYAELHAADAAGWEWIAVKEPPDAPEWQAIRDRLWRASQR